MWSGPVGLAETNSTLMCSGWAMVTRPQVAGLRRMPCAMAARAWSDSRTLRNPGGATSTAAMGEAGSVAVVATCAAIALAISIGARRYGLASFKAMLLAKSPRVASAGCSIVTAESTGTVGAPPAEAGSRPHGSEPKAVTWNGRPASRRPGCGVELELQVARNRTRQDR